MTNEAWITLFASIPIGIISGLYTGIIVSKYARFAELRSEALRVVRGFNYIGDGQRISLLSGSELSDLSLIASELMQLGHKRAGLVVREIENLAASARMSVEASKMQVEDLNISLLAWQRTLRRTGCNKLHLVWPFGGL
jgi:hypothetical protein